MWIVRRDENYALERNEYSPKVDTTRVVEEVDNIFDTSVLESLVQKIDNIKLNGAAATNKIHTLNDPVISPSAKMNIKIIGGVDPMTTMLSSEPHNPTYKDTNVTNDSDYRIPPPK